MKKLMILSVSLFVLCLQSNGNAQHLPDSTQHYLSINNNTVIGVLKQCIENVYEWNSKNHRKNGIFNIYVSNDDNNSYMRVIHYYPQNDSIGIMPDFYSYIDKQIVFWYMGKSHLSASNDIAFKEFVSSIYAKFAAEPAKIPQPLNTTNLRIEKRDLSNVPTMISAEDMKKGTIVTGLTTGYNLITAPPTFLISKKKNGSVSAIEENRIF